MGLCGQGLLKAQHLRQAQQLRRKLKRAMNAPAQHMAVRAFQNIFRGSAHRPHHRAYDAAQPFRHALDQLAAKPKADPFKLLFPRPRN